MAIDEFVNLKSTAVNCWDSSGLELYCCGISGLSEASLVEGEFHRFNPTRCI